MYFDKGNGPQMLSVLIALVVPRRLLSIFYSTISIMYCCWSTTTLFRAFGKTPSDCRLIPRSSGVRQGRQPCPAANGEQ